MSGVVRVAGPPRSAPIVAQGPYRGGRWTGGTAADPPVGSATMTRAFVLLKKAGIAAFPATANAFVSHAENPLTTGGWTCAGLSTGVIRWVVGLNTGVLLTDSPVLALASMNVIIVCASYNQATGTGRLRVNGQATSAVLAGTYVPPSVGRYLQIGARSSVNDNFLRVGGIAAFIGSDTVALDAAGLAALEASIEAQLMNGRRFTGLVANDIVYDARDAKDTWPSDPDGAVAGVTLVKNGFVSILGGANT